MPRKPTGAAVASGCITFILTATGLAFLNGLLIMLVAGGLHHSVSESVPAFGFWPSVLVGYALSLLGSFFRRRS